ncbi:MafI family immunity protein [Xylophilus ampelinus]|uniref:MafI family immunity protein n=1 Tax=Xylophilus ampelinus TaxID=54067 RepID=UPI0011B4DF81|nr:MafI family immunity protein [Xylophilus ampelinus]MCS4511939.1 MafI family immunity protein [Xylophilus ampelinus]
MDYELEIKSLISLLEDKLCENEFSLALEYFIHGENRLAFETLCDYLCGGEVSLSAIDYEKLLYFGALFGADLKSGRFKYLKNLSDLKPNSDI